MKPLRAIPPLGMVEKRPSNLPTIARQRTASITSSFLDEVQQSEGDDRLLPLARNPAWEQEGPDWN